MNSTGFWWTVSILFTDETVSGNYIAYIITAFVINVVEFIVTISAAINTRKGIHVEWWLLGDLTNIICRR